MASLMRMKKYFSDAKKALKKTNNFNSDLKKAREKLTVEEAARQASDVIAAKYKLEADAAQEKLHKTLLDLAEL